MWSSEGKRTQAAALQWRPAVLGGGGAAGSRRHVARGLRSDWDSHAAEPLWALWTWRGPVLRRASRAVSAWAWRRGLESLRFIVWCFRDPSQGARGEAGTCGSCWDAALPSALPTSLLQARTRLSCDLDCSSHSAAIGAPLAGRSVRPQLPPFMLAVRWEGGHGHDPEFSEASSGRALARFPKALPSADPEKSPCCNTEDIRGPSLKAEPVLGARPFLWCKARRGS